MLEMLEVTNALFLDYAAHATVMNRVMQLWHHCLGL